MGAADPQVRSIRHAARFAAAARAPASSPPRALLSTPPSPGPSPRPLSRQTAGPARPANGSAAGRRPAVGGRAESTAGPRLSEGHQPGGDPAAGPAGAVRRRESDRGRKRRKFTPDFRQTKPICDERVPAFVCRGATGGRAAGIGIDGGGGIGGMPLLLLRRRWRRPPRHPSCWRGAAGRARAGAASEAQQDARGQARSP
jgi:hypothetical protein